jgi:uncharacterized membrane protein
MNVMTELDLLNLARGATANEISWFAQILTINFAMVVAIYYFLNQAKLALRIFGFVAYMIGMLMYWGEMLIEANVKAAALAALKGLPSASGPARQFIGVSQSWLGLTTSVVFNLSFWILWIGVFYLLFFWKKAAHEAPR